MPAQLDRRGHRARRQTLMRALRDSAALSGAIFLASPSTSLAQQPSAFSEVRLGLLDHDLAFAGGKEKGLDINVEGTISSFVNPSWGSLMPGWLLWVAHPRVHVGIEANTAGQTNNFYTGLTWTAPLFHDVLQNDDAIEFSYLFGPSINDGKARSLKPNRKSLGSNILAHLGAELDYRISFHYSIGVYFDHYSNGGLARFNESINDGGLRFSYRF